MSIDHKVTLSLQIAQSTALVSEVEQWREKNRRKSVSILHKGKRAWSNGELPICEEDFQLLLIRMR